MDTSQYEFLVKYWTTLFDKIREKNLLMICVGEWKTLTINKFVRETKHSIFFQKLNF